MLKNIKAVNTLVKTAFVKRVALRQLSDQYTLS